ncbi:MAG: hypothetical protein FWH56_00200 [Betaproteobacteria bacterium]|nr:hypothetical protein [Betaproteobacteria bacterium]
MNTCEIDTLGNSYSAFVLSMIMASVLSVPAIITASQMAATWRLLYAASLPAST